MCFIISTPHRGSNGVNSMATSLEQVRCYTCNFSPDQCPDRSFRSSRVHHLPCNARLRPLGGRLGRPYPAASFRRFETPPLATCLFWLHLGLRNDLDAGDGYLVRLYVHRLGHCGVLYFQHVCVSVFPLSDIRAEYRASAIQLGWVSVRVYRNKRPQGAASLGDETNTKTPLKVKIWKILHGVLMFYSFVMLLGARISFPFR